MWLSPEKNKKGIKLDLGSGNPLEGEIQPQGYVLQDISPHEGIDLVCDIRDIRNNVNDKWCSEVRISHVLEHFSRKEMSLVLNDLKAILQDNGTLVVIVPNFMYFVQLLAEGNEESAMIHTYGGQLDEFDFHKNGFTRNVLAKVMREHGFVVKVMKDEASLTCEAKKL